MTEESSKVRIGQFSESPVLAVAKALGLGDKYGVSWSTERVASSPGQFDSLRSGDYDMVVTSPDNVLLYATTPDNPLKSQLDLRLLRPIDHGLGLALYTSPKIAKKIDFSGCRLGVDVMSSGFALLLLRMLDNLGVDSASVDFEPVGATPKRLTAITEGAISGSILNAEAALAAEVVGLRRWSTSADVSSQYLGTVLAQMAGPIGDQSRAFLDMWGEATRAILDLSPDRLIELLTGVAPVLASPAYVSLLQSPEFGCISGEEISVDDLMVLADIRAVSGAFTPNREQIDQLVCGS